MCHPAHDRPNVQKRCHAQAPPAHLYRARKVFQNWPLVGPLGPRRVRPRLAPPKLQNWPPPHRPNPDPTEPENPKNRGQKTGQFLGPENGPKNGSVFRTFIKIPCSEAEKRTHFQVHFLDLKTVPFFGRGFSISVYRAPQNRDRKRVHFSSLADPPGTAALPPSHRAPPLPIPSPPISQSTPHLSKKPSF